VTSAYLFTFDGSTVTLKPQEAEGTVEVAAERLVGWKR